MAEKGSSSEVISEGQVWSNDRLEMEGTRPHRVPQPGKIIDTGLPSTGLPSTAAIEVDSPSEASKKTVSRTIDAGLPSEASSRQSVPWKSEPVVPENESGQLQGRGRKRRRKEKVTSLRDPWHRVTPACRARRRVVSPCPGNRSQW